ncbi:hypothetical protein MRB53_037463 [Persea americana]|nr:hypothetical protein MRB53_037463 [Persea americana]
MPPISNINERSEPYGLYRRQDHREELHGRPQPHISISEPESDQSNSHNRRRIAVAVSMLVQSSCQLLICRSARDVESARSSAVEILAMVGSETVAFHNGEAGQAAQSMLANTPFLYTPRQQLMHHRPSLPILHTRHAFTPDVDSNQISPVGHHPSSLVRRESLASIRTIQDGWRSVRHETSLSAPAASADYQNYAYEQGRVASSNGSGEVLPTLNFHAMHVTSPHSQTAPDRRLPTPYAHNVSPSLRSEVRYNSSTSSWRPGSISNSLWDTDRPLSMPLRQNSQAGNLSTPVSIPMNRARSSLPDPVLGYQFHPPAYSPVVSPIGGSRPRQRPSSSSTSQSMLPSAMNRQHSQQTAESIAPMSRPSRRQSDSHHTTLAPFGYEAELPYKPNSLQRENVVDSTTSATSMQYDYITHGNPLLDSSQSVDQNHIYQDQHQSQQHMLGYPQDYMARQDAYGQYGEQQHAE